MQNIYFFIGTKAQAIKCIPLIDSFSTKNKYEIFLIDSGQHVEIVDSIIQNSKLSVQRINLFRNNKNVSSFKDGIYWIFYFIFSYLILNRTSKLNLNPGICIVHGDTLSTLLGLLWAKKNHLKILHLESGLTSKKLFNPFPEEIIRRYVSKKSDILIAFDNESYQNLVKKYKYKKIKKISENTIIETLNLKEKINFDKRVTVTLHRTENLISKKNLNTFINFLIEVSENYTVNWYLHEPTKNYLKKYKIEVPKSINLYDLLPHEKFLRELKKSSFVITDGGSIQEECYFLGKKTIIWRLTTERSYALNSNMFISKLDIEKSLKFLRLKEVEIIPSTLKDIEPSNEIINYLKSINVIS